jgi:biotin carboxylase
LDRHVVLVAPRFLPNTVRYIRAFIELDGVETTVISESPESALPTSIREKLAGHYRVPACMDARQLVGALRVITRAIRPVDRLVGTLEQLQLPLAEAREALSIPGMHSAMARNFRDKDRMKDVLRARGVPVARSGLVESDGALRSFFRTLGGAVIVKPQAGLGARSTYRLENDADVDALIANGGGPTH